MANFDAKFIISTAETVKNLQNVDAASRALDSTLLALDKTARNSSDNIKKISDSLANMVTMERNAAAAVKERAQATLAQSKADAQSIANASKLAESKSRVAASEAKAGTESAKAAAIRSKAETENKAKIDATTAAMQRQADAAKAAAANATSRTGNSNQNANVIAQGRLNVLTEQAALVQQRQATALIGTEAAQQRLNNSQARASRSTLELNDNLSNSRYLLYDVGATYRALSLAMLTVPLATAAVATSYEKDFAQVLRTTTGESSEAVLQLRDDLKDLGGQIPLTFGELSNIASLGAQLGLGADELGRFTEVTAKFVATTDVGVDAAATAFGRLKTAFNEQYAADPTGFFNSIGSAISELGTSSVATDSEIVAVMNQISPLGAVAGFSAQGVAGLSAALASVRIRPELARGSFQRIMSGITASAEQGSVAMQTYAQYMGMSGQAALELQKANPEEFFTALVTGLGSSLKSGVPFTQLLDDIGVKSVRDKQFVLALANNTDVLTDSMNLANKSFAEGTYLDESSKPVFQTLAASLKMMATDFANLADTIGGPALQTLANFVRGISDVASGTRDFIDANKGVGVALAALMGFGAFVGVLLAVKAAQAFVLAGMVAFQQVAGKAAITSGMTLSGGLRQAAITMLMLKGASQETAIRLVAQNSATIALTASTARLTGATTGAAVAGSAMGRGFKSAGGALLGMVGGPIGAAIIGVAALAMAFATAEADAQRAGKSIAEAMQQGAEAGRKAIAQELTDKKVSIFDPAMIGNHKKNVREIAEANGIAFDDVVASVEKGKGAYDELLKKVNEVAKAKGYADFADQKKQNPFSFNKDNASDLNFMLETVKKMGIEADKSSKDVAAVAAAANDGAPAIEKLGGAAKITGDMSEEAADQLDDLSDAIKGAVEGAFGFINLEAAVQSSLQKLGESLAKGGNDFSVYSEEGRSNLEALQKVFSSQAEMLGNEVTSFLVTPQDAAAQYGQYVDDVLSEIAATGVDVSQIDGLAQQVKDAFNQNLNTNEGVKAVVQVDTDAVTNAGIYLQQIQNEFGTLNVDVLAEMFGGEAVANEVIAMQDVVIAATGEPYVVTAEGNVVAAVASVEDLGGYAWDVTSQSYVLVPDADVNPAIAALQFLQRAAANIVNGIIAGINAVGRAHSAVVGFMGLKNGGFNEISPVGWGQPITPYADARAATPRPTAPPPPAPRSSEPTEYVPRATAPTQAAKPTLPDRTNFDGLQKGYDDVKNAAGGAGDAGKKAGEDMAKGIEEATEAVDDYADRLSQGLKTAFDRQYGLQSATDEYYKSLNAIRDKRKEDLKTIDDMLARTKELNNARNSDLVDARKAAIEKNISLKYGETDRAADYGNQEKTALDNAAAKQKDIEATVKSRNELIDSHSALDGYSNAAIANREALRGVELKMLDMIRAYAATGKSQAQVTTYTKNLITQFQRETTAVWSATSAAGKFKTGNDGLRVSTSNLAGGLKGAGTAADQMKARFNSARSGVLNMQGDMNRYINVVKTVPKVAPTKVSASNVRPTVNDLNWAKNTANSIPSGRNINVGTSGVRNAVSDLGWARDTANGIPTRKDVSVVVTYQEVNKNNVLHGLRETVNGKTQAGVQLIGGYTGGQIKGYAGGGLLPGKGPSNPREDNLLASVDGRGLIKVRSEEFIMQQPAVDYWGTDFMNSINNMKLPQFNMGGSPSGNSGGGNQNNGDMIVTLDANTMAKFQTFLNNPTYLFADAEVLASTVNKGGQILASKGVRN